MGKFERGDIVVTENYDITVLVTHAKGYKGTSDNHFSGVIIATTIEENKVGEDSYSWHYRMFEKLQGASIIVNVQ